MLSPYQSEFCIQGFLSWRPSTNSEVTVCAITINYIWGYLHSNLTNCNIYIVVIEKKILLYIFYVYLYMEIRNPFRAPISVRGLIMVCSRINTILEFFISNFLIWRNWSLEIFLKYIFLICFYVDVWTNLVAQNWSRITVFTI